MTSTFRLAPGTSLKWGDPVAEIAPTAGGMIFECSLPAAHGRRVEVGQPVEIVLDPFPAHQFGRVRGRTLSLAPKTEIDERGGATYRLRIAVEESPERLQEKGIFLRYGFEGRAEILTERKSLLEMLFDAAAGRG